MDLFDTLTFAEIQVWTSFLGTLFKLDCTLDSIKLFRNFKDLDTFIKKKLVLNINL
jgi:hypothetical protein